MKCGCDVVLVTAVVERELVQLQLSADGVAEARRAVLAVGGVQELVAHLLADPAAQQRRLVVGLLPGDALLRAQLVLRVVASLVEEPARLQRTDAYRTTCKKARIRVVSGASEQFLNGTSAHDRPFQCRKYQMNMVWYGSLTVYPNNHVLQ